MASSCYTYLVFSILLMSLASTVFSVAASLTPYYYSKVCPAALPTIKRVVEAAVEKEGRMGASLLRLHFHDCFVNGCDASVLLDPTASIDSEKNAFPNIQSLRGFEVVDKIKSEVDKACGYKSVVSCADILAVAARDSVVALGGPWWEVPLGRRDSTTASRAAANTDIPAPFFDLPQLIASFAKQGLDVKDLVALSGGHTLGYAQCRTFRTRIYNETNIDPYFAKTLKKICPKKSPNGDSNIAGLDSTPVLFDTNYFGNLVNKKGLLHSDQALFGGVSTDGIVKSYSYDLKAFGSGFAYSMVKMGNIKPLTGYKGQVRVNCRVVNKY